MENWVRIPILISLNRVLEGSGFNNLTKVIMEALTIGEGMPRDQATSKLMNLEQMIECVSKHWCHLE
jgi:hypothetical protein